MAEQAGYEPAAEPKGRGVGTRQHLIDAALGLFAVQGYDGVTTRALTRAAGVNLAAINYHFGGKQGLYRAVIEDIVALIRGVPMLVCWGERDFVFDGAFLEEWRRRFPNAEVHAFPDAGHYVLEDAGDRIVPLIVGFLAKHPVGASRP